MFYFPMAGHSSRFAAAGYTQPKFCLDIGDINLFQASLKGFSDYFDRDGFCFIFLESVIDAESIRGWAKDVGLPASNCVTVPVASPTRGQADTVRKGIVATTGAKGNDEEVVIFNIDTIYRDYQKPTPNAVNYLDVTELSGDHWSFVDPDPQSRGFARRVVEKERISHLCSVGLYGFESTKQFLLLHAEEYGNKPRNSEEYVAPLYQCLIDSGTPVRYRNLPRSRFDFLGTPQEFEAFLAAQK